MALVLIFEVLVAMLVALVVIEVVFEAMSPVLASSWAPSAEMSRVSTRPSLIRTVSIVTPWSVVFSSMVSTLIVAEVERVPIFVVGL